MGRFGKERKTPNGDETRGRLADWAQTAVRSAFCTCHLAEGGACVTQMSLSQIIPP